MSRRRPVVDTKEPWAAQTVIRPRSWRKRGESDVVSDNAHRLTQIRVRIRGSTMAIQALSDAARGAHFLCSYFALLPLVNRRFLRAWATDGPAAARTVHRLHGDRALAIAGAEVLIEGEHHLPAGGCVLVYNEASLLDLVLLNRYVYEHADVGVGAEVFAKFPWSREAFSKAGIVIFQRGDRSAAERMLNAVTQRVAQGAKLAMGGEGRLSRDGSVGHFKRGGCLVAIRAGVPVVPVALAGSPSMMPVGSLRLKPGKLRVSYGEPVSTEGWSAAQADQLAAHVRGRVVALRQ